jgi:hypothetical protein
MITATTATTASDHAASGHDARRTASSAPTTAFAPSVAGTPTAAGTCWRKMMTAMPSVKPSITGHGMKVTARPSRSMPAASTMRPASSPTIARAPSPWAAMIGASTTTMAPVGPDTCTFEPPNTAATSPATIAVTNPLAAPAPELTPNARASGSATTPTVMPATRSPFHVRRRSR